MGAASHPRLIEALSACQTRPGAFTDQISLRRPSEQPCEVALCLLPGGGVTARDKSEGLVAKSRDSRSCCRGETQ
ncbi:hypothetical protein MC885_001317 [Smutsia gigantea]|nr:hypothetical protein MC885_001317 [Smutsia gigantea]